MDILSLWVCCQLQYSQIWPNSLALQFWKNCIVPHLKSSPVGKVLNKLRLKSSGMFVKIHFNLSFSFLIWSFLNRLEGNTKVQLFPDTQEQCTVVDSCYHFTSPALIVCIHDFFLNDSDHTAIKRIKNKP